MDPLTTLNPKALEQLKDSSQILALELFFDYDEREPKYKKSLWIKPNKAHLINLKDNTIFEAAMEKKGRKTSAWKERHYILTHEFLAYKEVYFN